MNAHPVFLAACGIPDAVVAAPALPQLVVAELPFSELSRGRVALQCPIGAAECPSLWLHATSFRCGAGRIAGRALWGFTRPHPMR